MPQTIILATTLPAPPEKLYEMYLDSALHAAFTGFPVTIAAKPGAAFSAFEGKIFGTILHLQPKRLIVQSWRSVNFPADAIDSTLNLSFWPQGDGARVELVQADVPEVDFAGICQGWVNFYWNPWRAYLTQ